MKRILSIFCGLLMSSFLLSQVTAQFEVLNDGKNYCVIRNYNRYVTTISWAAVNTTLGQQRNGQYNMQPGEIAYFGPSTIGWRWQHGEVFYYSTTGETYSVPFRGTKTGYTGPCKKYVVDNRGNTVCCPCKGEEARTATGMCSYCPHPRSDHAWHN